MYKRNEPVWRFLRPGGVRERLRSEMLFSEDRRSVFNTSCLCVYQMFRKRCIFIMIQLYWTIQFLLGLLDFSLPMEHRRRTTGQLITEYIISYVFSVFLTDLVNKYKDFREQIFSIEKSITFSYRIYVLFWLDLALFLGRGEGSHSKHHLRKLWSPLSKRHLLHVYPLSYRYEVLQKQKMFNNSTCNGQP